MVLEQISFYFGMIDRLTTQYFYLKQWKSWTNPTDNIMIDERSYPIKDTWSTVFWRDCAVQTYFFEALLSL